MAEGRIRRAMRRLTTDDEELAAEDLQQQAAAAGATAAAECGDRSKVTILGTVKSVTLRPRAGVPALEVEVYDGSASVFIVWLGRRQIAGIRAGVTLSASGRVGVMSGRKTLFNPAYTIIQSAGH
ncbi:MAG TPA: OB-fold nucleic acid binding domain-containing protein [Mycobacteriales bacterium]|nr:OB-fold nucleic acid binding domain-containing protein [Mycobacteriales bacterium]